MIVKADHTILFVTFSDAPLRLSEDSFPNFLYKPAELHPLGDHKFSKCK